MPTVMKLFCLCLNRVSQMYLARESFFPTKTFYCSPENTLETYCEQVAVFSPCVWWNAKKKSLNSHVKM